MSDDVYVVDIEGIKQTLEDLRENREQFNQAAGRIIDGLEDLYEICRNEERHSANLLADARDKEDLAKASLMAAEAALAAAYSSGVGIPMAKAAYQAAKLYHEYTVNQLRKMERRYAMAEECLQRAQVILNSTKEGMHKQLQAYNEKNEASIKRLQKNYNVLGDYQAIQHPGSSYYQQWRGVKIAPKTTCNGREVQQRFTVREDVLDGILHNHYQNNRTYRQQLNALMGARKLENSNLALMVGLLAEKIVEEAFAPFGDIDVLSPCRVENGVLTESVLSLELTDAKLNITEGLALDIGEAVKLHVYTGKDSYELVLAKQNDGWSLCPKQGNTKDLLEELSITGRRVLPILPSQESLEKACRLFNKAGEQK